LNDRTFNCITVDSDTSTSDSLLCAATGASGVDVTGHDGFADALHGVMLDLAHQVVRDGEGATKFVEITVTGAATDADAKTHGLSVANSPLVKTAIAGEDPNWGRIVMAVGKSGAAADRDALSICFGDVVVADRGWVSPDYSEADSAAHMKGDHIRITVDIGLGTGTATVWTCDLTHGYISINADYRS
ncbi:MAG: bifunctional ornithine acetyltransferase/N-acetylglutamate synthase, partial [Pseudomonadota bacterium]